MFSAIDLFTSIFNVSCASFSGVEVEALSDAKNSLCLLLPEMPEIFLDAGSSYGFQYCQTSKCSLCVFVCDCCLLVDRTLHRINIWQL